MTTYARIPRGAEARSPEPYAGERDLPRSLHPYERRLLQRLSESPDRWETVEVLAWLSDLSSLDVARCMGALRRLGLAISREYILGYGCDPWRLSEEGERLVGVER